MALKRRLWGIRQKIPQGFYLGRLSAGDGDVELLTAEEMKSTAGLNITGGAGQAYAATMSKICIGV